jgi:hypothetical protein
MSGRFRIQVAASSRAATSNPWKPARSPSRHTTGAAPVAAPHDVPCARSVPHAAGRTGFGGLWLAPGSVPPLPGEFPRELGPGRGEALQGRVCWRSPGGFSTRAAVDSGIADEQAGECLAQRPAASAAQGRCVSSRRVALMETADGLSGQKQPAGSQVTSRVPRAQVAKVDHAAEIAVPGQQIGRMQIPVQPQSRACPVRRSQRILPDLAYGVRAGNQPAIGCLPQETREAFADIGQRATSAVPASRRVVRRGLMQGCQESRQGIGCLGTASRRGAVSRITGDPGSDNPRAREPSGRLAQTLRHRYPQGEARRDSRQQGMLLEEQLVCVLSGPGQPDREVVAEPPQLIVPATGTKSQRQAGQVGVLFAEQIRNQIRGYLIAGARHRATVALAAKAPGLRWAAWPGWRC